MESIRVRNNIFLQIDFVVQTLWCWSSINTHQVRGGEQHLSTGKTIGKKEMKQMDSMEESENFAEMMRFPCGNNFGRLKSWNNRLMHQRAFNNSPWFWRRSVISSD